MNDYTDFVETYPHIQDAKPAFWSKKSKVGHTHTCTEPTHSLDISPMKYPEPEQASNKKGKPMSYANVAAVHVAPQVQSDTAKKIEYLLGRVNDVYESFRYKVLSKMFNMDEFGKPKTHEQLIEAIKNGDFEIDEKKAAKEKEYVEKYGYAGYDPYTPATNPTTRTRTRSSRLRTVKVSRQPRISRRRLVSRFAISSL